MARLEPSLASRSTIRTYWLRTRFAALNALGIAARNRMQGKVIGVTGSAGKTGTKEALYAALDRSSRGKAHRSVKSYNNHVGVPLSLARMPRDTQFGVFEMGMNHAGEMRELTKLVRPHVALITTIAPAHIEFFKDESGIADAKAEIFVSLMPAGTAIIPADNPHYRRLRNAAARYTDNIVSFRIFSRSRCACARSCRRGRGWFAHYGEAAWRFALLHAVAIREPLDCEFARRACCGRSGWRRSCGGGAGDG